MSKYKELEQKYTSIKHKHLRKVFGIPESHQDIETLINECKDLEAKLERLDALAGTFIDLIISFPCDKQIENENETHFENCRRCKVIKSYHMRETLAETKETLETTERIAEGKDE